MAISYAMNVNSSLPGKRPDRTEAILPKYTVVITNSSLFAG